MEEEFLSSSVPAACWGEASRDVTATCYHHPANCCLCIIPLLQKDRCLLFCIAVGFGSTFPQSLDCNKETVDSAILKKTHLLKSSLHSSTTQEKYVL